MNSEIKVFMEKLSISAEDILESRVYRRFLNGDVPQVVWHYTSLSSLLSILSSGKLRMCHSSSMNDSREFSYGLGLIDNIHINDIEKKRGFSDFYGKLIDEFKGLSSFSAMVFIASFCRVGDSIPHWQMYADGGKGVSIGFKLKELNKRVGFAVVPVAYGPEDGLWIFRALVRDAWSIYKEAQVALSPRHIKDLIIEMGIVIDTACASIKMSCFDHEKEFRLMRIAYGDINNIEFFVSGGLIKPYIEYDISDIDKYISKIFVGPVSNQESVIDSIKYYINHKKLSGIDVEGFSSPYRF